MKHLSLFVAAMLALMPIGVFAEPIDSMTVNDETSVLTVTGTTASGIPYENVCVEVVRGGADTDNIADYTTQFLQGVFVDWQQVNTDENGAYKVYIDMNGESIGDYVLRISPESSTAEPYEKPFYYATLLDKQNAAKAISDCASDTALTSLLDFKSETCQTAKLLNLTDSRIFSVSEGGLARVLFAQLAKRPVDTDVPSQTADRILLSACLEYLNEGKVDDILNYSEMFQLSSAFTDTYKNKLTASLKPSFAQSFKDMKLDYEEDVNTAFCDKVILSVLNNIQNWSDVGYIAQTHGQYINGRLGSGGLDLAAYEKLGDKSKLGEKLGSGGFASLADFAAKFNTALSELNNQSTAISAPVSKGGGGSGGSGAAIKASAAMVPAPVSLNVISDEKVEFEDLQDAAWAEKSIKTLLDKKIINGVGGSKFEPSRSVLREEFIKMLMLAFDIPLSDDDPQFNDVAKSDWFYKYVSGAKKAGIISGSDDGSFGAGRFITRQDMAVTAYRAALHAGKAFDETAKSDFSDNDSINEYAKAAIHALKNASVIGGMGDGRFAPAENCTRAQAAKIICALIEQGSGE